MKYFKTILIVIAFNISLTSSMIAQSEQGYILGIKNFEKSFPSENSGWDSYDNLYMNKHYDGKINQNKLGLNTKEIIGKEIVYEYGIFSLNMVIESDSSLYRKDQNGEDGSNQKINTIHINNFKALLSWREADNTFVTMYSDYNEGKSSAFLYRDNGSITPVKGIIKIKK